MSLLMQSHGGAARAAEPKSRKDAITESLIPAEADAAVDEAADFGFLFPPSGNPATICPTMWWGNWTRLRI